MNVRSRAFVCPQRGLPATAMLLLMSVPAVIVRAEAPAPQSVSMKTAGPLVQEASPAVLRAKLDDLSRALDPYRVDGDIRTHLFFRYADAPYTRATIACLLIAERVLADALRPEDPGRPVASTQPAARGTRRPLSPQSAAVLFRWTDAALARVRVGSPLDGFLPEHLPAMKVAEGANTRLAAVSADGRFVAWTGWFAGISQPWAGGRNPGVELDLVACLGARLFVDARPETADDTAEMLADRAEFLGMVYRRSGRTSAGVGRSVAAGDRAIGLPAYDYDPEAVEQWRMALWARALGDGRGMLFSLDDAWLRPWLLEATAHCGLDFLRLTDALRCFPGATDVAVVGPGAVAGRWVERPASRSSGPDGLVAEVCAALSDAQVPVDVIPPDSLGDVDLARRYRVLFLADVDRLPPAMCERIRRYRDAGNVLLAVGRCLSDVPRSGPAAISFDMEANAGSSARMCEYVLRLRDRGTILADQIVPVCANGAPVSGLRSATARTGHGQSFVCLMNRTNAPLSFSLRYHGRALTGCAQELVADQPIELTGSPLTPGPYAIWILRIPAPPQ